jgi:hypothetical protein
MTAQELKQYFTNIPIAYPEDNRDDSHWHKGVEMCDWWLRLQSKQSLQQDDIDAFLARHRADASHRSVWMAIGFEFRKWALEKGFHA